jgi:hypothetical protein
VHARDTGLDEAVAAARGSEPRVYDGVAELWWDSVDQLVAAFSSDAGVAAGNALVEDERRFTNLPSSPLWSERVRRHSLSRYRLSVQATAQRRIDGRRVSNRSTRVCERWLALALFPQPRR